MVVMAPQPAAPTVPQVQGNTGLQASQNQEPARATDKPLPVPTLVGPEYNAAHATEASKTVAVFEQAVRSSSLGQGAGHGPGLTVDTEIAGRKSDETNLYDATPRGVIAGMDGASSPPPAAAAPEDTKDSAEPATQSTEATTQSTEPATQSLEATAQGAKESEPATPAKSQQQEMIRKMRLEAQDEKILVPGQLGLPGGDEPAEDPDKPKMSATSYPGQEWNPYGYE